MTGDTPPHCASFPALVHSGSWSEEDSEGNRDICSEILQMKALERLTSTVQSELAAALARKTRKALSEQDSETTETSHQEPRTPSEESSPLGGVCALRDGGSREELTSRLGLEAVQRLAKDGCRLLQNHNYRLPDRNQAEALGRVCLKERGRDVLVLQRVTSSVTSPSERPSPTSSGSGSREEDCDKSVRQDLRHNAGSNSNRQVKSVSVRACFCVWNA
ncbi:hypothetical protein PAMP_007975 [Pampus punctatissimus]